MASFTLKEIFKEFLRQRGKKFPSLTSEKMLEVNKAEGIRLKAEYKKLKQWDVTHGSIKK